MKKKNTLYSIGYWAILFVCAVFFIVCLHLIIDCAILYNKSTGLCNLNCACSTEANKDSNLLVVIGAASVGIIASVIQVALMIKTFTSSKKSNKEKTIGSCAQLLTDLKKVDPFISLVYKTNKQLIDNNKMIFIYHSEYKQFELKLSYVDYKVALLREITNSPLLYCVLGEENYRFFIKNGISLSSNFATQKIVETTFSSLDKICCKLDNFLATYYEGMLNEDLFLKFKNSYLLQYIEIIKFYASFKYENERLRKIELYNYKYLILFIKQDYMLCYNKKGEKNV